MKRRHMSLLAGRTPASGAFAFALTVLILAACSSVGVATGEPTTGAPTSGGPSSLTVLAAASLKGTLSEAAKGYKAKTGVDVTVSTDSSAALATQIREGAPADVFLSADTKNPQALADAGLTTGAPTAFAGNTLTIIVPDDDPAGISTPFDIANEGVKYIAAGDDVPITKYATQLIDNLAKQPGAPADFTARVAANTVSREDNVKAVVAKIELGEGDAGIVYVTDAAASDKVRTIPVDDAVNVPATYAGVVVKSSHDPVAAQAFLDWMLGPDGQAILKSYGFLAPP